MESAAKALETIANTASVSERMEKVRQMPEDARKAWLRQTMQRRVDAYNARPGYLHIDHINADGKLVRGDGYNCPLCNNRGDTLALEERMGGVFEIAIPCRCMEMRRAIWQMRTSGLENVIRECTFERFTAGQPWQRAMLDVTRAWLDEGEPAGQWLYLGGQPGCGKTHLCTAAVRELLYKKPVVYMPWEREGKRLKAVVNEAGEYGPAIARLEEAPVLYIDDLFKPVPDERGESRWPTGADVRLAFEILNYRYINRLPTLISSEWTLRQLIDIDEATASRVNERCGFGKFAIAVKPDRAKNYRLANVE